jgi:hypothetical protein
VIAEGLFGRAVDLSKQASQHPPQLTTASYSERRTMPTAMEVSLLLLLLQGPSKLLQDSIQPNPKPFSVKRAMAADHLLFYAMGLVMPWMSCKTSKTSLRGCEMDWKASGAPANTRNPIVWVGLCSSVAQSSVS